MKRTIISWDSPPKKIFNSTGSKRRASNFEFDPKKTLKRKSIASRRKFDFSRVSNENLNLTPEDDDISPVLNTKIYSKDNSPVLNEERHQLGSENEFSSSPIIQCNINLLAPQNEVSPALNTKIITESPILFENRHYSDTELETSPVINRKNRLIKLGKTRLNKIKNESCVRQLTELQENNNTSINMFSQNISKDIEIESVKSQIQCIKPEKNNKTIKIKPVNKNIFEKLAWKFKPVEEQIEIEHFETQETSNNTINKSNKTNIQFASWKFDLTQEIEIELVNSQEATEMKPNNHKINQTEIEVSSQEILTSESLHIEVSQSSRKTSDDEKCVIENVESQKSSLLTISSTGTIVQDSLEKSSEEYQLSPLKKKKYKPGTLAYQFHKLLRKQRADVAIWKHELYLTSTTTYQIPATKEDHLITNLKICQMFADFGSNVWECLQCDLDDEKCLIIVNSNFLDKISVKLKSGDMIQIIPPFFIKYILVNNVNLKAFLNVHKIVKL